MATITRPLPRKSLGVLQGLKTTDNGATWSVLSHTVDSVKNEVTFDALPTDVVIFNYQAFAKQTEPANNEVVYGGNSGVGKVSASSFYIPGNGMGLLAEALVGRVLKSSNGFPDIDIGIVLTKSHTQGTGIFSPDVNQRPQHESIALVAPLNNSHAFKALDYNVNINQQGFKQYAATELKHDGTDWGDDSKVAVVNGESTKTDLNGNTVKVVTHRLKEPLGYVRNKV